MGYEFIDDFRAINNESQRKLSDEKIKQINPSRKGQTMPAWKAQRQNLIENVSAIVLRPRKKIIKYLLQREMN